MMDLKNLMETQIKMFSIVTQHLNSAFELFDNYKEKCKAIDDDKVDKLQQVIESDCLNIILKERPFAGDLRLVTGIFKLCEDAERLGDHAEDIAWCAANLKNENNHNILELDTMIDVALNMVEDSFKSVMTLNDKLGNDVIKRDDIVDDLYLKVLDLLPKLKLKLGYSENFIIYTTLVTKYVERIADHASNIAEWAVYIKTGYYKSAVII